MTRVLVPLDESSQAEAALTETFELFPDATVHVLHVVEVTDVAGDQSKSGSELAVEEGERICARAREVADEYGRPIHTELIEGNAADTIVAYADENDIDHVVMGSTGTSGLSRVLLGSVAESVMREAPCSVTVVREA